MSVYSQKTHNSKTSALRESRILRAHNQLQEVLKEEERAKQQISAISQQVNQTEPPVFCAYPCIVMSGGV